MEDHFEAFAPVLDERFERPYGYFRPYVQQVIYRYLECGVLENGFARVHVAEDVDADLPTSEDDMVDPIYPVDAYF